MILFFICFNTRPSEEGHFFEKKPQNVWLIKK
nr:MAG TPA: hypothetical protein [Caudoviricetes sp.]